MIDKYVLATNDDGDLAIRTVSATESSSVTDTTSVITATDDGKLAVRVVGSGGGDQHNLGYYADLTALQTAHPAGTDGDFAILGSTDTIWVWDSGTSAWKDTDTKGQVTSVNNQTGAVTLTASDVGAATAAQGAKADTAVQPGDLATVATTGAYSDLTGTPTIPAAIQVSTMPTAAVGELDKIYQFIGTTDSNYTNGYFYKCVSDGQDPATYSWTQTDVQPAPSGLPDQTGQSGKFLTTDGTDPSWATINALQNTATGTDSITILGSATAKGSSVNIGVGSAATGYDNGVAIGKNATTIGGTSVGYGATTNGQYGGGIAIGKSSTCSFYGVALGDNATSTGQVATVIGTGRSSSTADGAIAIGAGVRATAKGAIQIGYGNTGAIDSQKPTNNEQYTLCVGYYKSNQVVNYKLLDSDGTIPKERLTKVVTTPSTAPVLAVADWSSNTQTITVTGVTATNTVFVAPAPASAADYAAAGILCTAQAANSLTFTCTTVPTNAITLSVVILG